MKAVRIHSPGGAEAEFRRALEIDPNYLAAYSALGAMFVNTNQQDRAIAEYTKIVERRPDNAAAYTLIGMLEKQYMQSFVARAATGFGSVFLSRLTCLISKKTANATIRKSRTVLMNTP